MRQEVLEVFKNKRLKTDCEDPYSECPDDEYLIPVVFHVVQNQDGLLNNPITDAQLEMLIIELNQAFAGTHTLQTTLDPDFDSLFAGNTKIRFVKAAVNPNGAPHSGIQRRTTWRTYFFPDTYDDLNTSTDAEHPELVVKYESSGGLDAWPRKEFFNIWICALEPDLGFIRGYATLPKWDVIRPQLSGVVLNQEEFLGGAVPTMLATHETGHWLGLLHTFTSGCTLSCGYTSGDLCRDTPTDLGDTACVSNNCDHKNMNENIMDYSSCVKMFTKDQYRRMKCQMQQHRSFFVLGRSCVGIVSSVRFTPTPTTPLCYGGVRTINADYYVGYIYEWEVLHPPGAVLVTYSPTPNIITISNTSPTYNGPITVRLRMALYDSLGSVAPCGAGAWFEQTHWLGGLTSNPVITSPMASPVANLWRLCNSQRSEFRATFPGYPAALVPSIVCNWTVDGGTIISGAGTNHIVVDWNIFTSGSFGLIKVIANNSCGGTKSDTDIWHRSCIVGRMAMLAPNPANGQVVLSLLDEAIISPSGLQITIKDLTGATKLSFVSFTQPITLNISSLQPGLYVVTIQNGSDFEALRLAVE
ncbi:MAG: T9SS C-terminal target domain-containing protein [Cytophagales bacterium]|nr:MAG: T9SS C-terminal target domain-containing protein [Cytophagales bacterium]